MQVKKLVNDNKDKALISHEKGILIAKPNLRKPMDISFVNKACCRLIKYEQNEITGMKINSLMPQLIAEHHHKYIERFLTTGKYGMINRKREQFIK
jgi:hypothetical protein